MSKIYIYQIYYDDATKNQIHPGFIPLNNSENLRPDWFEMLPILNFLRKNSLEDGSLYGFFSPKFTDKTRFSREFIDYLIANSGIDTDVFLFSHSWDQICYFLNPWEQGEAWHPGLQKKTQYLLDRCNIKFNIEQAITDSSTTVFSNYFIAKKRFWDEWKNLAEQFYLFMESDMGKTSGLDAATSYGSLSNIRQYPMKAFVQERFASILLTSGKFRVQFADSSHMGIIFNQLFPDNSKTRLLLQSCDNMKRMFRLTHEQKFLNYYWDIRSRINYTPPIL
jgi:hypothetical protein